MFVSTPLVIAGAVLLYLNTSYQKLNSNVESIRIILSKPLLLQSHLPIVYFLDSTEASMNYRKPIASQLVSDSILYVDLKKQTKLRQFRVYFSPSTEAIMIKAIKLQPTNELSLPLKVFATDQMQVFKKGKDELFFNVLSTNEYSYIESPRFYYPTDYILIVASAIVVLLISYLLLLFANRINIFSLFGSLSLSELSVIAFMFSIFLPQRFFNVTLAISILMHIKKFKIRYFLENKMNFFFIAFYTVILLNFFLVSPDYDFKAIEKYTILLILPIYIACIRSNNLMIFFCISVLTIGMTLLFGALIDISIFRNLEIISFENFTRIIHPVYYSYLIAFSIIYVELTIFQSYKYLIQLILILLLILSGSKLIIFTTLLMFTFLLKKEISLVIVPIVILGLLFFTPVKDRFRSISALSDLSVVSEQHIKDPNDPRLNGLTLRLILWQESLNFTSIKELILGRGVSASGNESFKRSLEKRGLLSHLSYNAHNQYVTTIFETGLIGLVFLMALLIYSIKLAISNKDKILLTFTILMSIAMLSESVLKRASGLTFFCMIILLLSNSKLIEHRKIDKENV